MDLQGYVLEWQFEKILDAFYDDKDREIREHFSAVKSPYMYQEKPIKTIWDFSHVAGQEKRNILTVAKDKYHFHFRIEIRCCAPPCVQ